MTRLSKRRLSIVGRLEVVDIPQEEGQRSKVIVPAGQSIEGLCFLSQSCPRKTSPLPRFVTPKSILSEWSPTLTSKDTNPVIDPSRFGDPSALKTGMVRESFVTFKPCFATYLLSMQDPSHPQSISASACCSTLVSKVLTVSLTASFRPLVPWMKTCGFLRSFKASMA